MVGFSGDQLPALKSPWGHQVSPHEHKLKCDPMGSCITEALLPLGRSQGLTSPQILYYTQRAPWKCLERKLWGPGSPEKSQPWLARGQSASTSSASWMSSPEHQWCHLQTWLNYFCLPPSSHEEGFRRWIEKCPACGGASEHSMHMFIPHPGNDSTWLKCRKGDPQCTGRWRSPEPGILQRDAFTPLPTSQPDCLPTLDSQSQQRVHLGQSSQTENRTLKRYFCLDRP